MNRRNFIVVTGTTTVGSGLLYKIKNEPSLALQSELGIRDEIRYTIRNENDEGFEQLNITLDTFNIETNNIDKDEIIIEMHYELNDGDFEDTFEFISMDGKSDSDIENEIYTITDDFSKFKKPENEGDEEENNVKIKITVKHEKVNDVEVSSEFKLNIAKEIIDNIKLTTGSKIEFPDENEDDVDFEGEDNEIATGIIETNTISEMTELDAE